MAAKKKKWSRRGHPKLAEAVARVLAGESAIDVANDVGMVSKNLYTAVSRARKKAAKAPKGKAVTLAIGKAIKETVNGSATKNPVELNITGLRNFIAFEVSRQLPEVVAAEMTKRLGRPM